jgi:hypothetical protein
MIPEEKLAIAAVSTNALLAHLFGSSVSIIDTKHKDDPSEWGFFSGTLIEIGDRLLVATASHCIENLTSPTRYWILGDKPAFKSDGVPEVLATHAVDNDRPDVGIIELNPKSFRAYSSKIGIPLSRVKTVGLGREGRAALLIGAPFEKNEKEIKGAARGTKTVVIGYTSVPINNMEWPTFNADPPLDQSIDILMKYPSGTADTHRTDTGEPIELPDPRGMSGGGLWDIGLETGEVWTTDSAFLFGIQSTWFLGKRFVRAVQIAHWLELVKDRIPELSNAIENAT